MELKVYIRERGFSFESMAERMGGVSAHHLRKVAYRDKNPSLSLIRRISEFSNGEVTANDFLHTGEASRAPAREEIAT